MRVFFRSLPCSIGQGPAPWPGGPKAAGFGDLQRRDVQHLVRAARSVVRHGGPGKQALRAVAPGSWRASSSVPCNTASNPYREPKWHAPGPSLAVLQAAEAAVAPGCSTRGS